MAATYFKIECSREFEMAGAGLGYEEIFGDEPRYFLDRGEADATCERLNSSGSDDLNGTYNVAERNEGDDADDYYCARQIVAAWIEKIESAFGDYRCSHEQPCAGVAQYDAGAEKPWRVSDDQASESYATPEEAMEAAEAWAETMA